MFKVFKRFDLLLAAAALVLHPVALSAMHKQARQTRRAELDKFCQAVEAQRDATFRAARHEELASEATGLRKEIGLAGDMPGARRERVRAELKAADEAWRRGEDRAASGALSRARSELETWRRHKKLLLRLNAKKE